MHQPAISPSISFRHPFNRTGGRTSNARTRTIAVTPTQTTACPQCGRKISFWDVATALYPVWLKCKGCGAKLIGDRLIKTQGMVIPIVAAWFGVAIALRSRWDEGSYILVAFSLLFACAMVLLTVRRGRYSLKGLGRSAGGESEDIEGEQAGPSDGERPSK